ncbi:MAG: VCBS repeat-containing protein [Saprospiraceae bacterium]|nr:VCBS repeat-containing protein [Saprospiraceae bacterium]
MKQLMLTSQLVWLSCIGVLAQASLYPRFVYEPTAAFFTGASSCGLARPSLYLNTCIAPTFYDWDQDGLIDLFFGRTDGKITYFHNVGTASDPCFEWESDHFGGLSVPIGNAAPFFIDLNGDNRTDCVIGNGQSASTGGVLTYFEGIGSVINPQFTLKDDTLAGYDLSDASVPFLTDIDNDGDFDLFVGEGYGRSSFIQNTGDAGHPAWGPVHTLSHDLGWRSAPQIVNIRGSEKKEWVSFESFGRMYIADDTCATPDTAMWHMPFNQFSDLDFCLETGGCWVRGAFADLNGDSLLDLLVSSGGGTHRLYYNSGTAQAPFFNDAQVHFLPIFSNEFNAAFADLNNDQKIEMYLPRNNGKIRVYENEGFGPTVSWSLINDDFLGITSTYTKAITFGDLNDDGLTDAVVGFIQAPAGRKMEIYLNQGQPDTPDLIYTPSPALENYPFLQTAIPTIIDYEADGEMDLIVTYSSILRFRCLNNSGTEWSPATLVGFPANLSATKLSFGDLDGDGDKDAIRSGFGVLGYFENKGSDAAPLYEVQPYAFHNDLNGVYVTLVDLEPGCGLEIWLDHQFWTFKGIKPAIKNPNPATLCSNNPKKAIEATPKGGWWEGADPSGNFDPGQGAGAYLIIYHFTDLYGCQERTDSVWVYVISAPNADIISINGADIQGDTVMVCNALTAQTLSTAEDCGYFSGAVTGSGFFNPSNWPIGTYTVSHYCYSDGCVDYDTIYIQITSPPIAQITHLNGQSISSNVVTICQNADPQQLGGTPAGGIFSGIASPDGTIYPNSQPPGIYTAIYQVEIGGCTSSSQIAIRILDCATDAVEPEYESLQAKLHISPNPAFETAVYEVELFDTAMIRLERYSLDGRLLSVIQPDLTLEAGRYRWEEPASSIDQFIRLWVNGRQIGKVLFSK